MAVAVAVVEFGGFAASAAGFGDLDGGVLLLGFEVGLLLAVSFGGGGDGCRRRRGEVGEVGFGDGAVGVVGGAGFGVG